jgi:hypothetical protein
VAAHDLRYGHDDAADVIFRQYHPIREHR